MLGYTAAEAAGRPLATLWHAERAELEEGVLARILAGQDAEPYETRRVTRQHADVEVSVSASPIREADGAITGVSQIVRDIGERRRAEQRIRYLNRVYATLSAINTLIVRARDHAELYQGACDIAVREGGFRMAWIGTITDEDDRLRLVASTGVEQGFLADIEEALSRNRGVRTGLLRVEQAVREGHPTVFNDARNDPSLEFRARFDALGVGSIALLPLSASGEALGALALYADEPEFFHADELQLLTELAGDIGFAVEHIRHQARIDYLAAHDVLTDLPNRLTMRDRVTQAISHARRAGQQLALMYIDLDRFKVIYDGHGHRYGDAVLRAVGTRLRSLLREEDSVGRESGDEFIVLLPGLRRFADAYVVAQHILDAFERPFAIEGQEAHLTASIGVSMFPQDGDTADLLIERADAAMYRGKELGRNTYQFFSRLIGEETQARVDVEAKLRGAIGRGELAMVYQPKVSLATGRIIGCEALLRWRNPDLGAVPPSHFIPIAEESGLIVPIGNWALRAACAQARAWIDAGLPRVGVSVNLSARQFLQQDVVTWVLKTLDETGLPPELLELELTESLIAQDTGKVIGSIDRLRSAGVRHSIDDFGTGYSSLAYLSRFKVDTLKIDQSFIRNMQKDRSEAVIPIAVISLAHSLRLEVIAEGVETAEQCALLREHGCDAIQGYLFSPPVDADAFAEMLGAGRTLTSTIA
jgi:diguanylate cyclase (GGDEF)-like protein/PAS domain S-box-containing protein